MSRPRPNQLALLAEFLGLDAAALRSAGSYDDPLAPAGQPRLRLLPFEQLSDEAFEAFVRDLIRGLHPSWQVTRNGSTGFKQYGVDVFADDGKSRIGVQCKHEQTFGPSDVREAVAAVLPKANISSAILALSRPTATPNARIETGKHDGWELWDGEDLASRVRDLPMDRQLRLINAYFPRLREDFLGVRDPSPWQEVADFDISLAGRLAYDRDFELTGRDEEFARLEQLVSEHQPLVLVVGRGGIGKSRLLVEMARAETAREVRFAAKGGIAPDSYELLPTGAPIVVIDDAMDPDAHFNAVVAGVRQARPDATVVLSIRPNAAEAMQASLGLAQADAEKITVEVGDLASEAAEDLARTALDDDSDESITEVLAAIGYDCPLLIVLGAHLVRAGNLSTHELTSNAELKSHILTHFADVIVAGPGDAVRNASLVAIATVQPARLEEPDFLEALTGLSGLAPHELMQTIDVLEDLGVVLRRGQSVRVVPDLLGEALLERALVSRSGADNKFADHVAQTVHGNALANAIRSVSMIDFHRRTISDSHLAEVLWTSLIDSALLLPNSERVTMANGVEAVAAVHPGPALDLAEQIINNPAADERDPLSGLWGGERFRTAHDTERSLSQLIRNACYSLDQMSRGMRLLLSIGLTDARPENQNPSHSLRLLREMGEYSPDKPLAYNRAFVAALGSWLADESLAAARGTIISLLKPALAREITVTRSKQMTLQITRMNVNLDNTADVRSMAIELAIRHIEDADLRAAISAVGVLEEALRAQDRDDPVTEEFERVSRALRAAFSNIEVSPTVRLSAFRALNWYATYGRGDRRAFVRELRRDVAIDNDYLATKLIRGGGWGLDNDEDNDSYEKNAAEVAVSRYERSQAIAKQTIQRVISAWSKGGTDQELVDHLLALMRRESHTTGRVEAADRLLIGLFDARPGLARFALSSICLGDEPEMMVQRVALITLVAHEDPAAVDTAATLIALGPDGAAVVASATIAINGTLTPTARSVIRELCQLDNARVSERLLTAARWWDQTERGLALEVIEQSQVESSPEVAEDVAELLADGRIVDWTALQSADRQELLRRFAVTPRLASYAFGRLLNEQITIDAFSVLRFLQSRITRSETEGRDYEAIPFDWDDRLNFRASSDFGAVLSDLAEWLTQPGSWQRVMHGTALFKQIVGRFDEEVLTLILSLMRSGTDREVDLAASLLGQAERTLVLSEPQFVEQALTIAQALNLELAERIIQALHRAAAYGWGSRKVGVDNPEELALIRGAEALADKLPAGTPLHEFYVTVAEYARSRMNSERARDAQLYERRRW